MLILQCLIVVMVMLDWLVVVQNMKEELKCVLTEHGVQFVDIVGVLLTVM